MITKYSSHGHLTDLANFKNTWAPRGAETAQILYNISQGWVTHNEANIVLRIYLVPPLTQLIFADECLSIFGNRFIRSAH